MTDSSRRIHGVDNLFVAESSVLPTGSSADPGVRIRDIASERLKAEMRSEWSSYHSMTVRSSVCLLEAFGDQEDGFGRPGGGVPTT